MLLIGCYWIHAVCLNDAILSHATDRVLVRQLGNKYVSFMYMTKKKIPPQPDKRER